MLPTTKRSRHGNDNRATLQFRAGSKEPALYNSRRTSVRLGGPFGDPAGRPRAALVDRLDINNRMPGDWPPARGPCPRLSSPHSTNAPRAARDAQLVGSGGESARHALPAVCPCDVLSRCRRGIGVLLPSIIGGPVFTGQNPARRRRRGVKTPRRTGVELTFQATRPQQSPAFAKTDGRRTPIPRQYLPTSPHAHLLWPILAAASPRVRPRGPASACARGHRRPYEREKARGFIPPGPW